MPMTEDQNASIRAFAATNPSPAAIAAAQAQYGVSQADYASAINPTQNQVNSLTDTSTNAYNAYANSGDYGNVNSASYQNYQTARGQQNNANDAFQQNAFRQSASNLGFNKWEAYNGQNQGATLASATGDTSFVYGNPQAAQAAAAANPNVVVGGSAPGTTAAQGLYQPTPRPTGATTGTPVAPTYTPPTYTPPNPTPQTLANSQGYTASNVNLSGQYGQMGGSDPTQANARLLSGQVNNPYLDAQANNITSRLNRNLQENVLPGIGQGATMAGQYGGSRQGIAQGKAIGDTQDNLANSLTNLYGSANEAAQNRMSTAAGTLSGIGAQVGVANAGFQNQASQFGANASNQAALANASNQNAYGIAGMNNATTQRGQDYQMTLGSAQNANQATATANNYNLGLRSNDLGFANLDASINQNNFQNNLAGANFGLSAYNALNNSNANGTSVGNTAQNTPITNQSTFQNNANAIGNGYGTTSGTTGTSSNPYINAVGGAQVANSAYNNLGFSTPRVQDNGYSTGTGNAYAGTTTNGVWAPNRAGM